MIFPYKIIDLTHTLDKQIPSWSGGCGFNIEIKLDYSDCRQNEEFRVQQFKMHAGIGTHMDAPAHCIPGVLPLIKYHYHSWLLLVLLLMYQALVMSVIV